MRARRLSYAAEALEDFTAIRAYWSARASPRVSARILLRIREAIRTAREMPSSGSPRPEYRPNCRFVVESPYVIYYDYDGAAMIVLRILHRARNRDQIMSGEN